MSGTSALSFFVNVAVGAGEMSAGALGVLGAVGGYVGDKLGGIASGSPNDITSDARERSAIFFAEPSAKQKGIPVSFNRVPALATSPLKPAASKNSPSPASLPINNTNNVQQALEASRANARVAAQRTQAQLDTASAKLDAQVKQDIQSSDYKSTVSLLAQNLHASSRMHQLHPESPIATPITLDLTRLFKKPGDASPAFAQVTISKQELLDAITTCWTTKAPLPAYLQQVMKQHSMDLSKPMMSVRGNGVVASDKPQVRPDLESNAVASGVVKSPKALPVKNHSGHTLSVSTPALGPNAAQDIANIPTTPKRNTPDQPVPNPSLNGNPAGPTFVSPDKPLISGAKRPTLQDQKKLEKVMEDARAGKRPKLRRISREEWAQEYHDKLPPNAKVGVFDPAQQGEKPVYVIIIPKNGTNIYTQAPTDPTEATPANNIVSKPKKNSEGKASAQSHAQMLKHFLKINNFRYSGLHDYSHIAGGTRADVNQEVQTSPIENFQSNWLSGHEMSAHDYQSALTSVKEAVTFYKMRAMTVEKPILDELTVLLTHPKDVSGKVSSQILGKLNSLVQELKKHGYDTSINDPEMQQIVENFKKSIEDIQTDTLNEPHITNIMQGLKIALYNYVDNKIEKPDTIETAQHFLSTALYFKALELQNGGPVDARSYAKMDPTPIHLEQAFKTNASLAVDVSLSSVDSTLYNSIYNSETNALKPELITAVNNISEILKSSHYIDEADILEIKTLIQKFKHDLTEEAKKDKYGVVDRKNTNIIIDNLKNNLLKIINKQFK